MNFSKSTGGKLALRRLVLALSLSLAAGVASAEISQTLLEQAEAVLKSGKADEAYKLLEPLEVEGAGDLVFDYLLGTAALESGRPSKATFVYERILAAAPEYVGVRADMGRAYYALGDFGRAKIEFETVLSFQNLPPDLRGTVEQYVKAAEASAQSKRTVANGYFELGWGADNNFGSATNLLSVNLPVLGGGAYATNTTAEGTKTPDSFASLALGGEVNHQMTDRWSLYAGGDYRQRGYQTYTVANNYTADVRAGLSYSGGPWLVRGGIVAGQLIKNNASLRDTAGLTLDWRLASTTGSQYTLGLSVVQASYVPVAQKSQNNITTTMSGGWLTSLGDGSAIFSLTFSGGLEADTHDRDEGQRTFYGPRAFVQKVLSESLGGFVSLGATNSTYSKNNALYLEKRSENLYDLSAGMTWTVRKGLSLRPQVVYIRNNSSAELYTYDKAEASVNLRFDF